MQGGANWENEEEELPFRTNEDGGQLLILYLMSITMLNLLVGLLSEKLGDIVAIQKICSYQLLL